MRINLQILLAKNMPSHASEPSLELSLSGDHDGILDQDEFVNGIYEVLHPTTKEGMTLAARIAKGNVAQVSNLRFDILTHLTCLVFT